MSGCAVMYMRVFGDIVMVNRSRQQMWYIWGGVEGFVGVQYAANEPLLSLKTNNYIRQDTKISH